MFQGVFSFHSSPSSPASGSLQKKTLESEDMVQKNKLNGIYESHQSLGASVPNRLRCRTLDEESDKILRQLLGKDLADNVSSPEKLSLEFQDGLANRSGKRMPPEKREFKLARLRQIMQRSLSESDTDSNNSEDPKNTPIRKIDKPRPQPIVESVENSETLQMMIKKHTQSSTAGRRFILGLKSKSVDGHSPSPTSESSDPDNELQYQSGSILQSSESALSSSTNSSAQKTTSPKSALKSPSSKRKTSQNLKLRVTFEDPIVQIEQTEVDNENKDGGKTSPKASTNSEIGEQQKRTFGALRSIMETFSNNQNNNNNSQSVNNVKAPSSSSSSSSSLSFSSLGRKSTDTKASQANGGKGKNKTVSEKKNHVFSITRYTSQHLF